MDIQRDLLLALVAKKKKTKTKTCVSLNVDFFFPEFSYF
jgi:hypothetical protein